jgi:hypothetical protein
MGTIRCGLIYIASQLAPEQTLKVDRNTYECMRPKVVRLDVLKVARLLKRGHRPIQLAQPAVDRGVAAADRTQVALEVRHIHRIEADLRRRQSVSSTSGGEGARKTHDSNKETDVGFGEAVADEVLLALEHLLDAAERLEERDDGGFVCLLRGGESGLVHAI